MKLLAAILVFMIAAQPVQAGFCGLDLSVGSNAPAAAHHGDADAGETAHDCCQPAEADRDAGCMDMPCGACAAGLTAVAPSLPLAGPVPALARTELGEGIVTPSHASPPFRPPIFVS